jgi:rhodanese-related sulfurtransferase
MTGESLIKLLNMEKEAECIYDLDVTRYVDHGTFPNRNNIIIPQTSNNHNKVYTNQRIDKSIQDLTFSHKTPYPQGVILPPDQFKVIINPPKSHQILAPVTENNLSRFTNMSKMTGASILTLKTGNKDKKVEISPFTDFLLLDLRSEPEYLAYHIKDSINYPALNIGRDRWSDCILRYKNKPEKFIVVYMESEKSGIGLANELYQKGFENVYLLTGGIYEFVLKHHEYVEGDRIPMVSFLLVKNRKLTRCRLLGITV